MSTWITNLLIFFFVIILAMVFGMTIVNVVDKRLSEVTIKIPKQEVVVNMPNDPSSSSSSSSSPSSPSSSSSTPSPYSNFSTVEGFTSDHTLHTKPQKPSSPPSPPSQKPKVDQNLTPFTNGNESVCTKQHAHGSGVGGFCQYGPTNYAYPQDMSSTDRQIFKMTYPANMTLQDYINWLWLYQNTPDLLTKDHRKNFEALKRGMVLSYSDMPSSKNSPPLNSKKYFDKLYDLSGQINWRLPLNMDTNGLLGYNYTDYSEFGQNFDQMGTSSILSNPYELPIKQSARFVDKIVRNPQLTNSAIRDRQKKHLRSKMDYCTN